MANRAPPRPSQPAGFVSRALASRLIGEVAIRGHALDEAFSRLLEQEDYRGMAPRDVAFARLVAITALRHWGEIETVLASFIARPLPENKGDLRPVLYSSAVQLLFLGSPAHAVINVAVEQCRRDRRARRFAGLVNAVLRGIAERGQGLLAEAGGAKANVPNWLFGRWAANYGPAVAERIARASLTEAALDLSVKADAKLWAVRLGAQLLRTGSLRLAVRGRIEELPGYQEGAWWPQDAAAALPARLFGAVAGQRIADLCAAPGGKSAQLAAGGAVVTAVDISEQRLALLKGNLARLGLAGEAIAADATTWAPGVLFDGVLIDVPCLATGTIRRHPDVLRLKRPSDLKRLTQLQARLLKNAMALVRPGGRLVYACCSLEPEEGVEQVERALAGHADFVRVPIGAAELGADPEWITPAGDLRTLPFHLPADPPEMGGMDGFYAARLERRPHAPRRVTNRSRQPITDAAL
ncbi:MAG TPA: RsmB/NOP family class I SAM-dependent RNA methyltransferase [Hyphomicrobiaceae bacterium]|nr:RsmB/NOP family class I SAM-dependent RNA methyltransferase [Hyphomicrobiaceae bacterium]